MFPHFTLGTVAIRVVARVGLSAIGRFRWLAFTMVAVVVQNVAMDRISAIATTHSWVGFRYSTVMQTKIYVAITTIRPAIGMLPHFTLVTVAIRVVARVGVSAFGTFR